MAHFYSTEIEGAKALGRDLPISFKHSVEVCRFVKGKNVHLAKQQLKEVIELKRAVPYRRFNQDLGHKRGMMSGRYPVKTTQYILKLIESAEKNAQFKGMNTEKLTIIHIAAHKASRPAHGGRHRGRAMKRAHIELIVQEIVQVQRKMDKKEAQKKEIRTTGDHR